MDTDDKAPSQLSSELLSLLGNFQIHDVPQIVMKVLISPKRAISHQMKLYLYYVS